MCVSSKNEQKNKSFKDKWENNPELAFQGTQDENSEILSWILTRNGFKTLSQWKEKLSTCHRILDAGCGNGRVTALLSKIAESGTDIVAIDNNSVPTARKNLSELKNVKVLQKDLLEDLSSLGRFDYIYCQEVLHHTSDPQGAFRNLVELLSASGEISIYVYKRKAPAREFVDEYIRDEIKDFDYEKASFHCSQMAEFGRSLSNVKQKVHVPSVDILKIEAGEYDVQRLIYHFFFKCFWNDELSEEANSAINYDWYHPQLASKHSLAEVEGWFFVNGLRITHSCVDPYGITISGKFDNSVDGED